MSINKINSHNDKIPKEGSECNYLSLILIHSVYYPQVFLEERKCFV